MYHLKVSYAQYRDLDKLAYKFTNSEYSDFISEHYDDTSRELWIDISDDSDIVRWLYNYGFISLNDMNELIGNFTDVVIFY